MNAPHSPPRDFTADAAVPEFIAKMLYVTQEIAPKLRPHFDIAFDYSESSLAVLDAVITGCWPEPPKQLNHMVAAFGSYLGETIRRCLGGQWMQDTPPEFSVIRIGGADIHAFPFTKTRKRFLNGIEDSLAIYFATIKTTLTALSEGRNAARDSAGPAEDVGQ